MKAKVSYAGTSGTKLLVELEFEFTDNFDQAQAAWKRLLLQLRFGDNCPPDPIIEPIADALDELLNGPK